MNNGARVTGNPMIGCDLASGEVDREPRGTRAQAPGQICSLQSPFRQANYVISELRRNGLVRS